MILVTEDLKENFFSSILQQGSAGKCSLTAQTLLDELLRPLLEDIYSNWTSMNFFAFVFLRRYASMSFVSLWPENQLNSLSFIFSNRKKDERLAYIWFPSRQLKAWNLLLLAKLSMWTKNNISHFSNISFHCFTACVRRKCTAFCLKEANLMLNNSIIIYSDPARENCKKHNVTSAPIWLTWFRVMQLWKYSNYISYSINMILEHFCNSWKCKDSVFPPQLLSLSLLLLLLLLLHL